MIRILIVSLTWILLINYGLQKELEENPLLGTRFSGRASYYGSKFHGRTTANGEKMDKNKLTCAHRTLPFNTMIEVTSRDNGRKVVVRVNDRGPFSDSRVIDLSSAAADSLQMKQKGVIYIDALIVGSNGEVYASSVAPIIFGIREKNGSDSLQIANE